MVPKNTIENLKLIEYNPSPHPSTLPTSRKKKIWKTEQLSGVYYSLQFWKQEGCRGFHLTGLFCSTLCLLQVDILKQCCCVNTYA